MKLPKIPKNENDRLEDLKSYSILDTLSEKDYDDLTAIASEICNTSISLVSLIDDKRQWFKSHHGLSAEETPKAYAFCAHAINNPNEILIVPDSRKDERFHDNPLVTGDPRVIFYAGVPLISKNGYPLGTLCVIDDKPKVLTKNQLKSLTALANQVMRLMELRKQTKLLDDALSRLKEKNEDLEKFAFIASHDLNEPLRTVDSFVEIIKEEYHNPKDTNLNTYFSFIHNALTRMRTMIDSLLDYSRLGKSKTYALINIQKLITDIKIDLTECITVSSAVIQQTELPNIICHPSEIRQVFHNLIINGMKFQKPNAIPEISISYENTPTHWQFCIADNGIGISPNKQKEIFEMFTRLHPTSKYDGLGIGLAFCKKIIEIHNGNIWVESLPDKKGSKFYFTISKHLTI